LGISGATAKRREVFDRWRDSFARPNDVAAAVILAVAVRLIFWVITDRVWEDALITVTHARNAVAGIGLTHHPGEPVTHGFTSAVSVLIPLLGEVVVRGSGIFVLKAVSVVAAAFTIVVAARICGRLKLGRWTTALVLVYLAVDQNQIFYGMAGMETQVAVLVLLSGIDTLMSMDSTRIGVSWALAILTRPDFLLWIASAGLDLLARSRRSLVRAAVIGLLIVLPWLIFTTIYYGSPIPNTILAKSAHFVTAPPAGLDPAATASWLVTSVGDRGLALLRTFTPFYEDTLVVSAPLPLGLAFFVSIVVWLLAFVGAIRSWRVPGWRAAVVFAAAFTAYRFALLPGAYFDWYVPPHTAVLIILAAIGIERLRPLPSFDPRPLLAVAGAVLFAVHLPLSTGLEAKLQQAVENGVRREVGLELGRQMRAGEAVVTESAGYYEFYSNATMYDYPGLTSPKARTTLAALPLDRRGIEDLIDALRPDWLALRPPEWEAVEFRYPETAAEYEVVRTVSAPPGSIEFDAEQRPRIEFLGYRKDASSWQILVLHRRG
jgi:hypothetical protein